MPFFDAHEVIRVRDVHACSIDDGLRKLKQLDLARRIVDLRAPPANRLDQPKGDRAGQSHL